MTANLRVNEQEIEMPPLTADDAAFKEAYIRSRGYWVQFNDDLLRTNPSWLKSHLAYADTTRSEGPLDDRMRELIYIAVDASTTHLYLQGLDVHLRKAFELGCSAGELIEVLLIAATQGLDSIAAGVAILAEEVPAVAAADETSAAPVLDRYAEIHGDRPAWLAIAATMFPRYADALVDLLEVAEAEARLTPRERALIRVGLAASPTHLDRDAMRTATRAALAADASPAEILQVLQLVSLLGMHACVDGVPAVMAAQIATLQVNGDRDR
jgi:alkylhydroperoxidase/carboxymuconolactone decarboxylase family protein YurZ